MCCAKKYTTVSLLLLVPAIWLISEVSGCRCGQNTRVTVTISTKKPAMKNDQACLTVKVQDATRNADVENGVESWMNGKRPVIRSRRDQQQNLVWVLCWDINTVLPDEEFTRGAVLKDGSAWDQVPEGNFFTNAISGTPKKFSALPTIRLAGERTVEVTNPSSSDHLRVANLELALSSADVPLDSLAYSSPSLQGLPWFRVIDGPTVFEPEETHVFNLPVTREIGSNKCYGRLQVDNVTEAPPLGIVFKVTPPTSLPVLSASGLTAVILTLLACLTIKFGRRRAVRA